MWTVLYPRSQSPPSQAGQTIKHPRTYTANGHLQQQVLIPQGDRLDNGSNNFWPSILHVPMNKLPSSLCIGIDIICQWHFKRGSEATSLVARLDWWRNMLLTWKKNAKNSFLFLKNFKKYRKCPALWKIYVSARHTVHWAISLNMIRQIWLWHFDQFKRMFDNNLLVISISYEL